MLFERASPALSPAQQPLVMEYAPIEPATSCAAYADDDDEALQAVLLASLCASEAEAVSNAEQAQLLDACVAPALVGPAGSIRAWCAEVGLGSALDDLERPPHHLRLLRVRGDGHCLFRCVCASIVLGAAWDTREAIATLQQHLDNLLAGGACAHAAVNALRALLGHPSDGATGVLVALNEEGACSRSDRAVAALREAAASYMRKHAERFRHCAESDADLDAYCARMGSMGGEAPAYGGHSELVTLSELLQVRIEVVDASDARIATYRLGEHLPPTVPNVHLLRRGLHYHLLLPASPVGEAL